jgi:hypothetical protein
VLEFLAEDGTTQTLSTTDEHPFWSVDAEDYISAGDLQLGDHLIGPEGEIATLIGSRCEEHPEGIAVYNFEVAGVHNYYVRALGLRAPPLRVHNAENYLGGGSRERFRGIAKNARWAKSRQSDPGPGLRDHFDKHGDQVGAWNAKEYDISARKTIQNGREFTYRDPTTNETRVGYWDAETGYFAGTTQTRKRPTILTHFPVPWSKIRTWPGFSAR